MKNSFMICASKLKIRKDGWIVILDPKAVIRGEYVIKVGRKYARIKTMEVLR